MTSTAGNQLGRRSPIALVLGGMPVNSGAKVRFYSIILRRYDGHRFSQAASLCAVVDAAAAASILSIIFLAEMALFSDRKTGMIVSKGMFKSAFKMLCILSVLMYQIRLKFQKQY